MLLAHLVPGYAAVIGSRSGWDANWTPAQRRLLWAVALGSTAAPDVDVLYNVAFRGFFNHSTLWTHSILVHLGVVLGWGVVRTTRRSPYLQTLLGLAAVGGLSHLVLDMVSHNTPLLYPFSMKMFGIAPEAIVTGGLKAYLTHPIFLLELFLLAGAAVHWHYLFRRSPHQGEAPENG
jgi:hypothetical protein